MAGLSGCSDIPQARTESEIREIATEVAEDIADAHISALEARIDDLEAEVAANKISASIALSNVDNVSETVARNAKIANDNILSNATSEGRCGAGWVKRKDGNAVWGNIPCTAKDLWGKEP